MSPRDETAAASAEPVQRRCPQAPSMHGGRRATDRCAMIDDKLALLDTIGRSIEQRGQEICHALQERGA